MFKYPFEQWRAEGAIHQDIWEAAGQDFNTIRDEALADIRKTIRDLNHAKEDIKTAAFTVTYKFFMDKLVSLKAEFLAAETRSDLFGALVREREFQQEWNRVDWAYAKESTAH